jgi:alpha-L-fucosidase
LRWVGNERGIAGDPCWATLNRDDFAPGEADQKRLTSGDRPGTHWIPAECDVSIRPGWFYHAAEDAKVKSATQLVDLYFASVGRGASLLLNLAPDQRGQIPDVDVKQLLEFRRRLDAAFATDLTRRAKVSASNVRAASRKFHAANTTDLRRESYWATDDGVTNASLVIEFRKPTTLNIVRLREYLPLGQRVEVFALDRWRDGAWVEFHRGTGIGNCRLVRVKPFSTDKLRVRIINAPAATALSEVGVFLESDIQ